MENAKKIAKLLIREIEFYEVQSDILDVLHSEHDNFEDYKRDLLDITPTTLSWFWGQVNLIGNILEEHTM